MSGLRKRPVYVRFNEFLLYNLRGRRKKLKIDPGGRDIDLKRSRGRERVITLRCPIVGVGGVYFFKESSIGGQMVFKMLYFVPVFRKT